MKSAKTAMKTIAATMTRPTTASGLERKMYQARPPASPALVGRVERRHARLSASRMRGLMKATSEVDDDVHDQEGGGDDQHRADDRVEVLPDDHLDAVARDARPDEDLLDQEGVAEERREIEPEDGQRRDEGRAEGVARGDAKGGKP